MTWNSNPIQIRKLISRKRKAKRTWQNTRTKENKTILNSLSQQLTREIRKIKNESTFKH